MESVPDQLGALSLPDADDNKVRLGDLWADKPAAFVFIRHFGCPSCRAQVTQLRDDVPTITGLGANLVLVGNGAPHFARAFREEIGLDCPILCDTDKKAYGMLGMHYGRGTLLTPGSAWATARSMAKGFMPKGQQGDRFQQGGVLVVARGGRVLLSHQCKDSNDTLHPSVILHALRGTGSTHSTA